MSPSDGSIYERLRQSAAEKGLSPCFPGSSTPDSLPESGPSGDMDSRLKEIAVLDQSVNDAGKENYLKVQEEVPRTSKKLEDVDLVSELSRAITGGDIGVRSALGARFTRMLKTSPEQAEAYKNCGGSAGVVEKKKQFRLQWAKDEYESKTTTREHVTSFKQVFGNLGTYMPVERIIHFEGGVASTAAIQASVKYVEKALSMGGDMIRWNPMTERSDILYVCHTKRDEFATIFSKTISESASAKNVAAEAQPLKKPKTEPADDDGGAMEQAAANAKPKAAAKGKAKAAASPRDGEMSLKQHMVKAQKTKRMYHEVMSTYNQLLLNVSARDEWQWARNEGTLAPIRAAATVLSDNLSDFGQRFMCCEIAGLRAAAPDEFPLEVQKLALLDGHIEHLAKHTKRLVAMQAANIEA
jgi:hypothetical protein